MSEKKDEIRKSVSETYGEAVTRPSDCGSGPCCAPVQKGVVAKLAGYTSEELTALPPEAVVNSFGCGNPLAFSEVGEGEVVLDLGSGAGIDILLAAKKVGPKGKVIGVDMTGEMIKKAKENIAAAGLDNVEVRKGLIEKMPVDDGSVDWVISNCAINLSPEKDKVFAEIARVLKPGGRMLVSDMVVEKIPAWLRGLKELYGACISGAISEGEYLKGLEDAGLESVEVRERFVYEKAQLVDFIQSEVVPGAEEARKAFRKFASGKVVRRAASDLEGRVASIQVYARKEKA